MIGKLLQKFREARAARRATDTLKSILANEAATLKMQGEAQASGEAYALLTPAMPIPGQTWSGWFGGAPHLPDDLAWPKIDGEALRFVCQIDLSSLPADIWSGLGPRRGALAVFLHPQTHAPKVCHVDGALKRRDWPGQADAVWRRPHLGGDHSPEWPIKITRHVGDQRLPMGYRTGKAPGFPDPCDIERPDLADPAFQPFNEATLSALIDILTDYFLSKARTLDAFLEKHKLRDADRTALLTFRDDSRRSLERFVAIKAELAPFTQAFAREPVTELVAEIASFPTYELQYLDKDAEGYAILSHTRLRLSERPDRLDQGLWWYVLYADVLYGHSVCAYTRDPEALPCALRGRMETIWRFEAIHEQGAMGHAPLGHLYTPHGPSTKTVVLLELPTSSLVGWVWGGDYSIALFIKRNALARGDFRKVTFEITN